MNNIIPIPFNSAEDLASYARLRKEYISTRICNVFYARLAAALGYGFIEHQGPTLIGRAVFESAIKNRQMPPLIKLIELAARLNMYVVLKLVKPGNHGSCGTVRLGGDPQAIRSTLASFMEDILRRPRAAAASEKLQVRQETQVKRMRQYHFPIHWSGLITFFAASGYEMEVWLVDLTPATEIRLPKALTSCHRRG